MTVDKPTEKYANLYERTKETHLIKMSYLSSSLHWVSKVTSHLAGLVSVLNSRKVLLRPLTDEKEY